MDEKSTKIEKNNLIAKKIKQLQNIASEKWLYNEQYAVITIIRALELAAGIGLSTNAINSTTVEEERFYAAYGAALALEPFLHKIKDLPGGIPWMPSNSETNTWAISYLITCGKLAYLQRLSYLERYGLSKVTENNNEITITVKHSTMEFAQTAAIRLSTHKPDTNPSLVSTIKYKDKKFSKKMESYVATHNGWFIRYDNDESIVNHYREKALDYASRFLEGEALPEQAIIGGRSFRDWKIVCENALGRILCHIDFAKALKRKNPEINLQDVNTLYARKDDIAAVWIESGLAREHLAATMDALTIKADELGSWIKDFELPCPFYIEYSKDFLLIPCFGPIANPYFALFRHLRMTYTLDWDKAVDQREKIFRDDLSKIFPNSHYAVPSTGFKLRNPDNSILTDIDAVVIDRFNGNIALIQLKWHDIVGKSLTQRDSRRKNIVSANKWVSRVYDWANSNPIEMILTRLGVNSTTTPSSPPTLFVIARYTARFSGDHMLDERAHWMGWHEMLELCKNLPKKNRLKSVPLVVAQFEETFNTGQTFEKTFNFKELTVNLRSLPVESSPPPSSQNEQNIKKI